MGKSSRQLWTTQILEGKTSKNKANSYSEAEAKWRGSSKYIEKKITSQVAALSGSQLVGKVLGIDPSLRGTGLAMIQSMPDGSLRYLKSETVKNPPAMSMTECLGRIFERTLNMIDGFMPDCIAIEQSVYVQNFKTAMILGSSRGAAIAAAGYRDLKVYEYPPLRIKQAVIGYGRASKEQVARSVMALLNERTLLPSDEADAAGAAITHIFTKKV